MNEEHRIICTQPAEHCPHVAQAADDAVRKVFAILGVDIDVPKDVEQFRENLRFGASMRRAADKGVAVMFGAIASTLIVAGLAALWVGIVSKFKGGA